MIARGSVVRHFDRAAAGYDRFRRRGLLGILRTEEERAVRQLARVQSGQIVLDAGCGPGATLDWLCACGIRAAGVDLSFEMARRCRAGGHAVWVQDFQDLSVRRPFDWVLCIGSIEFARDPAAALSALAAALAVEGRLVLLFPRRTLLGHLYRLYHRSHRVEIHLFRPEEVDATLRDVGLRRRGAWLHGYLSSVGLAVRADGE